MKNKHEWLRRFSNTAGREIVAEPYSLEWEGELYSLATDGRALVMLKGDGGFKAISERSFRVVKPVIENAIAGAGEKTIELAALKGWCRECELYEECDDCNGTGETFCIHCEREGAACGGCLGEGRIAKETPGRFLDVIVNKGWLWFTIEHLPDCIVKVGSRDKRMLALASDRFIVALMGLDPKQSPKPNDVFCESEAANQ